MPAIATSTATYTVQPFATVPVDGDAGDVLERIADALDSDARAHGPALAYDYDRQRVSAIFQIEFDAAEHTNWFTPAGGETRAIGVRHDERAEAATRLAVSIFDRALEKAGFRGRHEWTFWRTIGVSIVEGDDPDLLP